MAKKRRESKAVTEVKKQIRREIARRKREYNKQKYNEVIEKNKIEDIEDYLYLYKGLTIGMKRIAVIDCIVRLHKIYSMNPQQIIAFLKKKEWLWD